jgi:phosphatidylinositol-bisphosphatase
VCSHLASGGKEGDEKTRNANAIEILSSTRFSRGPSRNLPRKILDHE